VQVHDDDLGSQLPHQPYGHVARAGFARDLDAALLEQVSQACAEQVVIVDQQDVDVGGGFLACRGDLGQMPPFFLSPAGRKSTATAISAP
jgi:hypothetical protein